MGRHRVSGGGREKWTETLNMRLEITEENLIMASGSNYKYKKTIALIVLLSTLYYLFNIPQKMVEHVYSLEAGLDVKYLIMLLCIEGIRQQHRTTAFTAMIPGKR